MTNDFCKEARKKIEWDKNGISSVPDILTIPYIIGDGIGPDIWAASQPVFDVAVQTAYGGQKRIKWLELLAGEKAQKVFGAGNPLPEETFK
jgi:isocitrate dehydrogenase